MHFAEARHVCGPKVPQQVDPHHASTNPAAPPRSASRKLSASSCLTIDVRGSRRARCGSRFRDCRAAARARRRFATFAQAIRRTSATAPNKTSKRRSNIADHIVEQRPHDARRDPCSCRDIAAASRAAIGFSSASGLLRTSRRVSSARSICRKCDPRLRHLRCHQRFQRHDVVTRLRLHRELPSGRHHAEHGGAAAGEVDLLSNDLRVLAERALPEPVAEDDDVRLRRLSTPPR